MVHSFRRETYKTRTMKIIDRGYLNVKGRQPFIAWVEQVGEGLFIDEESESNVYLVEEDFFEVEPIVKANFKKIFLNELECISDDESLFPEIKLEVFLEWFNVDAGTMVFDCEKGGVKGE